MPPDPSSRRYERQRDSRIEKQAPGHARSPGQAHHFTAPQLHHATASQQYGLPALLPSAFPSQYTAEFYYPHSALPPSQPVSSQYPAYSQYWTRGDPNCAQGHPIPILVLQVPYATAEIQYQPGSGLPSPTQLHHLHGPHQYVNAYPLGHGEQGPFAYPPQVWPHPYSANARQHAYNPAAAPYRHTGPTAQSVLITASSANASRDENDTAATASPAKVSDHGLSKTSSTDKEQEKPSTKVLPRPPARGPPRKPKQSGFALWVGNLPPESSILDLKDHFSRDATNDIESLFLMSTSNCAFVNYRTAESCQDAMLRFHDSAFEGVRLVCRLRHNQSGNPGNSAKTVSAIGAGPVLGSTTSDLDLTKVQQAQIDARLEQLDLGTNSRTVDGAPDMHSENEEMVRVLERFFVVKSLTQQDLDTSVRNGLWATQEHNEAKLNAAYNSAEAVYLVFSVNKSGEFFGFAKMLSAIEDGLRTSSGSRTRSVASDGSNCLHTEATEFAPKGRVIDDVERGTIFWEVDTSESEDETEREAIDGDDGAKSTRKSRAHENLPRNRDLSKSFRLEWLSTNSLPFHKTKGMRNAWNSNREIKVARDGTELEPIVGRKLVDMFERSGETVSRVAEWLPADPIIVDGSNAAVKEGKQQRR